MPLTTFDLWTGYIQGAFPMANDVDVIEWWRPHVRALFPIEGIHVSRSLAKVLRRERFTVTFDQAFREVMWSCRRPDANWINQELLEAYTAAHQEGWAHSCEVWREGRLVGGSYGLALGSAFCAESMFHRETDASKVALHSLISQCRSLGFTLFDAQLMNPHLASLGVFEIPHRDYMKLLSRALRQETDWGLKIDQKFLR